MTGPDPHGIPPGVPPRDPWRVLVIKLGALGDFVLAFRPFAAIRTHHPSAEVTLLTTAPFAELARRSPWFDRVLVDGRPAWWDLPGLLRLRRQLRGFHLVYDLQTSGRSSRYFLLAGRPPWSGIARGASLPHANPDRDRMHTLERQADQLRMAGIAEQPEPALGWLRAAPLPPDLPAMPRPYALLVPGAAPHRPAKRWPAQRFGELAARLAGQGLQPVVAGGAADAPLAEAIRAACPGAVDLTGQTGLAALGRVAAGAALAVGNDTGPMHLAAALGCPCLVLFSGSSDPLLTAPRGNVTVLREASLADLQVDRVAAALPQPHTPLPA